MFSEDCQYLMMSRVKGNTLYGDASMFAVGLCQS